MKGYDIIGRPKRMGQREGVWWMGLYKDSISGAMSRLTKVGALFLVTLHFCLSGAILAIQFCSTIENEFDKQEDTDSGQGE